MNQGNIGSKVTREGGPKSRSRAGSLLVVVAGLSAIIFALIVTILVRSQTDARVSDQIVRTAQARMLLLSAADLVYATANSIPVASPTNALVATRLICEQAQKRVAQLSDPADSATWGRNWIRFNGVNANNSRVIQVVVGCGSSVGVLGSEDSDIQSFRQDEVRYCFDLTLGNETSLSPFDIDPTPDTTFANVDIVGKFFVNSISAGTIPP
jgi:hypothetical protein